MLSFLFSCFPYFPYNPFDLTYNHIEKNIKRLGNRGLKAIMSRNVSSFTVDWNPRTCAIYHLGDKSLHKDREFQKSDLAKKMVLSGLLPLGRNWLFTEKFQLFLR